MKEYFNIEKEKKGPLLQSGKVIDRTCAALK